MEKDRLFQYLYDFILNMLPFVTVFFLPMEKRRRWPVFIPLTVLLLAGVVGVGVVLFPLLVPAFLEGQVFFLFHYLLVFSAYGAGLYLMCPATRREVTYSIACAYMSQHLSHCLHLLTGHLLNDPAWLETVPAIWAKNLLVAVLVWLLFARKICQKGHYPDSALRALSLLAFLMAVMYFLSIYVSELENGWLHGLYAGLLIILLMMEELRAASQLHLQAEIQAREIIEATGRAQYEISKENIALINRKSHDLRRQIAALRTVGTPQEQDEAIAEIEQAVEIYDSTFQTGCRSLDTVLMQKALVCSQNGIQLSVVADGARLRFVRSVDLFTMVSNILDNAIEANLRLPSAEQRSIHLSVRERKGLVILQCENPYTGTVEMKDGLPVTSKEDRENHGIGTRSIAATAAQYGGVIRIDPSGGMYVLRVIFQGEDTRQGEKTTIQDKAV